jgi:hypothetical protein
MSLALEEHVRIRLQMSVRNLQKLVMVIGGEYPILENHFKCLIYVTSKVVGGFTLTLLIGSQMFSSNGSHSCPS